LCIVTKPAKIAESFPPATATFFMSWRNGMVLPCSPGDFGQCVSVEQAKSLFEAGDWSFHHKYTFKVSEGGALLGYSRPRINDKLRVSILRERVLNIEFFF